MGCKYSTERRRNSEFIANSSNIKMCYWRKKSNKLKKFRLPVIILTNEDNEDKILYIPEQLIML